MRFESPWERGFAGRDTAGAEILGPANYQFLKKTKHHSPHTIKTLSHALRAPARWRIFEIFWKTIQSAAKLRARHRAGAELVLKLV